MSQNFAEVQEKWSRPNQPTNWRLLTISFDPEKDTPAGAEGVTVSATDTIRNIGTF